LAGGVLGLAVILLNCYRCDEGLLGAEAAISFDTPHQLAIVANSKDVF
jgi:hypothetical protein